MLVLFESADGYGLFKVLDKKRIGSVQDVKAAFADVNSARETVQLLHWEQFQSTADALEAAVSLNEHKVPESILKSIQEHIGKKTKVAVAEQTLAASLKEDHGIPTIYSEAVGELMRGLREHVSSLVDAHDPDHAGKMQLGLAHSMSRFRLRFGADSIDTMIVQAVSLLDDVEKELNHYGMRVREWYGWHFPELGNHISEPQAYARACLAIGIRPATTNMTVDILDGVCPPEVAEKVIADGNASIGAQITEEDMERIGEVAQQVLALGVAHADLHAYLLARVRAVSPNLAAVIGEVVTARLIGHAGSLLTLSKYAGSTIQIIGAEKALFRALQEKANTPKYGIIFHAKMLGQCAPNNKGKLARALGAVAAICARVDAFSTEKGISVAPEMGDKLEKRIRELEGNSVAREVRAAIDHNIEAYTAQNNVTREGRYFAEEDVKMEAAAEEEPVVEEAKPKKEKKSKKEKKEKKDKKEKKSKKDKSKKKDKRAREAEEEDVEAPAEAPAKRKKDKKSKKSKDKKSKKSSSE